MGEYGRNPTAIKSFSVDLETLNYLALYAEENNQTVSAAIRYHIKMGRAYIQQLEYQRAQELMENVNGVKDVET